MTYIHVPEDRTEHVGVLINALSLVEGKRQRGEVISEGLWLLTVASLAQATLVEAVTGHELWCQDMGDVEHVIGPGERDVVAEVRRVVLGEDVPWPKITITEVLRRMGIILPPDGGDAG